MLKLRTKYFFYLFTCHTQAKEIYMIDINIKIDRDENKRISRISNII